MGYKGEQCSGGESVIERQSTFDLPGPKPTVLSYGWEMEFRLPTNDSS